LNPSKKFQIFPKLLLILIMSQFSITIASSFPYPSQNSSYNQTLSWDTTEKSEISTNTWEQNKWIFGPEPKLEIRNNGVLVNLQERRENWKVQLELDSNYDVIAYIPKDFAPDYNLSEVAIKIGSENNAVIVNYDIASEKFTAFNSMSNDPITLLKFYPQSSSFINTPESDWFIFKYNIEFNSSGNGMKWYASIKMQDIKNASIPRFRYMNEGGLLTKPSDIVEIGFYDDVIISERKNVNGKPMNVLSENGNFDWILEINNTLNLEGFQGIFRFIDLPGSSNSEYILWLVNRPENANFRLHRIIGDVESGIASNTSASSAEFLSHGHLFLNTELNQLTQYDNMGIINSSGQHWKLNFTLTLNKSFDLFPHSKQMIEINNSFLFNHTNINRKIIWNLEQSLPIYLPIRYGRTQAILTHDQYNPTPNLLNIHYNTDFNLSFDIFANNNSMMGTADSYWFTFKNIQYSTPTIGIGTMKYVNQFNFYINLTQNPTMIHTSNQSAPKGTELYNYNIGSGFFNYTWNGTHWAPLENIDAQQNIYYKNLMIFSNVSYNIHDIGIHHQILLIAQFSNSTIAPQGEWIIDANLKQNNSGSSNPLGNFGPISSLGSNFQTNFTCINLDEKNYWNFAKWGRTGTGAISLDNQEYFVKCIIKDNNTWNKTSKFLDISIITDFSAHYNYQASLGYENNQIQSTWTKDYIWYSVYSNGTQGDLITPTELNNIKSLVWDNISALDGNDGYTEISELAMNQTSENMASQAYWIENLFQWYSLNIDINQSFSYDLVRDNNSEWHYFTDANYNTHFSGLSLFTENNSNNDLDIITNSENGLVQSNELNHVYLIQNIENIEFIYPYINTSLPTSKKSGKLTTSISNGIKFGVKYNNISGYLLPSTQNIYNLWDSMHGNHFQQLESNISEYAIYQCNFTDFRMDFNINFNEISTSKYSLDQNIEHEAGECNIYSREDANTPSDNNDDYWQLIDPNNHRLADQRLSLTWASNLATKVNFMSKYGYYMQTNYTYIPDFKTQNENGILIQNLYNSSGVEEIKTISDRKNATISSISFKNKTYLWNGTSNVNLSSSLIPNGLITQIYDISLGSQEITAQTISNSDYFISANFPVWDTKSIKWSPTIKVYFDVFKTPSYESEDEGGSGTEETWLDFIKKNGVSIGIIAIVSFAAIVFVIVGKKKGFFNKLSKNKTSTKDGDGDKEKDTKTKPKQKENSTKEKKAKNIEKPKKDEIPKKEKKPNKGIEPNQEENPKVEDIPNKEDNPNKEDKLNMENELIKENVPIKNEKKS
jgi:hypothetical protein